MNSTSIDSRRFGALCTLFELGMRPFFLGAGLWAVVSILVWIGVITGKMTLNSSMSPIDWHVHELLFGYTGAVIAGFLLTAVPNWTDRPPTRGMPLVALFTLWVAGRLVLLWPAGLGHWPVGAIDLAFPIALIIGIARDLIASGNKRNYLPLMLLILFTLANALFHLSLARGGSPLVGVRLGLGSLLLLIMVIGGRIVPGFTRNWLAGRGPGPLPGVSPRFDALTIIVSAVALAAWTFSSMQAWVALLMCAAGVLNSVRLLRWVGYRSVTEPLVLILHIGYAFVPLGFVTVAVAGVWEQGVPAGSAIHLWTAGAVGMMTMAVMTRASLGHSGRPLHADIAIAGIYIALLVSVATRFAAGYGYGYVELLSVSALAWVSAYLGFVWYFARLFIRAP